MLRQAIFLMTLLGFGTLSPQYSATSWADEKGVEMTPAQEAEASKRVNRLSDQLKSPFCPGKTLLTCTSSQAFDLRKEMTAMILAGKSDAEILSALRDSFGDELEPPPQPWYLILVYIIPLVLGGLVAATMFSRWLRDSRGVKEDENMEDQEVHQAYQARLQSLLGDDE